MANQFIEIKIKENGKLRTIPTSIIQQIDAVPDTDTTKLLLSFHDNQLIIDESYDFIGRLEADPFTP
ncbi:MAG: hypothetical protein IAF38_08380 [Bacteroidia bacterium]|nr:hypothetical protein [Bacteroidia bacterium]